jgi:YebC/PmpR family DNA-binding regulatory protein
MGRIFETRKATMFARWDKMAKIFTRISKDIAIAVKSGGPNIESNPALRRAVQNARAANMPKDKVESAIKRASGQGGESYQEILYEGYGPHGVAVLVETATDNPVRTVANVRMHFSRKGGNLANSGSVAFQFKRMGVIRLLAEGLDADELAMDLIDHGLDEISEGASEKGDKLMLLYCNFGDFGQLSRAVEEKGLSPVSSESEYVPSQTVELSDEAVTEVLELIDRLEQDDDVQKVFHNLA